MRQVKSYCGQAWNMSQPIGCSLNATPMTPLEEITSNLACDIDRGIESELTGR